MRRLIYDMYYADEISAEIAERLLDRLEKSKNDVAIEFNHDKAIDLLRLVFFNDHIPSLHTHSYSFNTATGRHIIEMIKNKYYEYESTS